MQTESDRPDRAASVPRGWPIAIVLILGTGLFLLVVGALVSAASYQIARSGTAELVRDKSELLMRSIEERVRNQLDPVEAQLQYLARLIKQGGLDLSQRPRLEQLLLASLAAVPQVSAVAFVDPNLQVLRAFRGRTQTPTLLTDWSDDPGFQRAMAEVEQAEGSYWGELFVAEEAGTTLINLFTPLRSDRQFVGALVAGVSIQELSRFVGALEGDYIDNAFILYDRDSVLAHPRLTEGFPGLSDDHPLPSLSELGDPALEQIWSSARIERAEADFTNGAEARVVDVAGQRFVFLFRELLGYGGVPWLIGTYVSLDEVAPQLRRLTHIWWVGLLVFLVALGLALIVGYALSRPVRQLSRAVARVRDLDLEPPPAVGRGPFRELNEVAETFGAMVDGLRMFATYVPRPLVRRLIHERSQRGIASEEREVSVMFTDIVGFTSLAEDLPAAQVAELLNQHFTLVGHHVDVQEGIVDKYMGDAVLAFWGAPSEQSDHAKRACRAALAIAHAVGEDNAARLRNGLSPLWVRIGIHSGPAVVGNIGAPSRINYTIIGDTVNTAQRLEELSRRSEEEVSIVIGGETAQQLGPKFRLASLGHQVLRGRHEPLEVFRLQIPDKAPDNA